MSYSLSRRAKKFIIIVVAIVVLFGIYNLIWIGWKKDRYMPYTQGLEEFVVNTSYVYTAEDSYLYNVKLPDYLTYTGNMCVAVPDGSCALLIWPKVFKDCTYGVQIKKGEEIYSIMLKKDFSAEDSQFNDILEEYADHVAILREKAKRMWGI